jgi:hypothetical protein
MCEKSAPFCFVFVFFVLCILNFCHVQDFGWRKCSDGAQVSVRTLPVTFVPIIICTYVHITPDVCTTHLDSN